MAPAAIVMPCPVRYCERNTGSPTGIVTLVGSVIEINGHRKSFQLCRKMRIAKEQMADFDKGAAILRHILSQPQPSIFAASNKDDGKPSKKFFRIMIASGAASDGAISEK